MGGGAEGAAKGGHLCRRGRACDLFAPSRAASRYEQIVPEVLGACRSALRAAAAPGVFYGSAGSARSLSCSCPICPCPAFVSRSLSVRGHSASAALRQPLEIILVWGQR